MAKILAVCLSERRGTRKHPVAQAVLRPDHGIEGDAHAGNWHRQVSLLGVESVEKVRAQTGLPLKAGDFAENLLTEGICLYELPLGTRLGLGPEAVGEVTQIGKECHTGCAIRRSTGDCVMPREGIFVKILQGGVLCPGDELTILSGP